MDTPFVRIDLEILEKNIRDMADFARAQGIRLRPHVKTHKIAEITRMQLEAGSTGITVAKLGEAEAMFAAGARDILVAYPLVGAEKLTKVRGLLERGCKLTLMVDSVDGARLLDQLAWPGGIDVLVEVDSGLGRGGLLPEDLEGFVQWLVSLKHLNFKGLLTFEGHSYACQDLESVKAFAVQIGEMMVAAAEALRAKGIPVAEVSIGSTPSARWGGAVPGITEIRPGNYVFNDATQVALGVAKPENCSLKVVSTIVSRPAKNRALIDAGAKILAKDHGRAGYGLLANPNWQITRLWEEHGLIEGDNLPELGSVVEIIPNHSCPVVNLVDTVAVSNGEVWKVTARGLVR
ncbi:MAG: alanine racemase [Bacillota bacterium]|jgi:D-serine deaminase-like pyridoxal phosphate-dependent protein